MVEPFKPDWDEKTVLVEEMQRMAKRIEELEQKVAARSAEHLAAHITHDKGYQEGRQDTDRKTYQAGYNAGVAHHKQATEREWIALTDDAIELLSLAQQIKNQQSCKHKQN